MRALTSQDIVIVALGGENMDVTTSAIVASAERTETRRIITINAGGIYGELPEPFETWDHAQVGSFRPILRRAADVVEQSSLAFTILRPVWLTDDENTDYELTRKGQSSPAPRLHARVSAPSSPYLSNTLTPTSGKAWASRGPAPTGAGPPPTAEAGTQADQDRQLECEFFLVSRVGALRTRNSPLCTPCRASSGEVMSAEPLAEQVCCRGELAPITL